MRWTTIFWFHVVGCNTFGFNIHFDECLTQDPQFESHHKIIGAKVFCVLNRLQEIRSVFNILLSFFNHFTINLLNLLL